jgi:hypothetical protein
VGDDETDAFVSLLVASHRGPTDLRHGRVAEPGVLAANRKGMELVRGDIVCFIDDDAAARPDWLLRIERWFATRPELGAVGGRDVIHTANGVVAKRTKTVARIYWYGRIVGNHEKIFEGSCEAEHLKGVNMSFRRELLPPFDELILGNAHHYETDLCFAVRRRGYGVLFDGDLVVDHYQDAPRYLSGNQAGADAEREYFIHHNRVYVMMKNLGAARRAAFLFYTFVVDGGDEILRLALRKPGTSTKILGATFRGKVAGLRDYVKAHHKA